FFQAEDGIRDYKVTGVQTCALPILQRKTSLEECARLRDLIAEPLRQKCQRFALDNALAIAAARPAPEPALNDRAADIWEPLFAQIGRASCRKECKSRGPQ